jgi:hypothetical protein
MRGTGEFSPIASYRGYLAFLLKFLIKKFVKISGVAVISRENLCFSLDLYDGFCW